MGVSERRTHPTVRRPLPTPDNTWFTQHMIHHQACRSPCGWRDFSIRFTKRKVSERRTQTTVRRPLPTPDNTWFTQHTIHHQGGLNAMGADYEAKRPQLEALLGPEASELVWNVSRWEFEYLECVRAPRTCAKREGRRSSNSQPLSPPPVPIRQQVDVPSVQGRLLGEPQIVAPPRPIHPLRARLRPHLRRV